MSDHSELWYRVARAWMLAAIADPDTARGAITAAYREHEVALRKDPERAERERAEVAAYPDRCDRGQWELGVRK